jgi:hypothetical protein
MKQIQELADFLGKIEVYRTRKSWIRSLRVVLDVWIHGNRWRNQHDGRERNAEYGKDEIKVAKRNRATCIARIDAAENQVGN